MGEGFRWNQRRLFGLLFRASRTNHPKHQKQTNKNRECHGHWVALWKWTLELSVRRGRGSCSTFYGGGGQGQINPHCNSREVSKNKTDYVGISVQKKIKVRKLKFLAKFLGDLKGQLVRFWQNEILSDPNLPPENSCRQGIEICVVRASNLSTNNLPFLIKTHAWIVPGSEPWRVAAARHGGKGRLQNGDWRIQREVRGETREGGRGNRQVSGIQKVHCSQRRQQSIWKTYKSEGTWHSQQK